MSWDATIFKFDIRARGGGGFSSLALRQKTTSVLHIFVANARPPGRVSYARITSSCSIFFRHRLLWNRPGQPVSVGSAKSRAQGKEKPTVYGWTPNALHTDNLEIPSAPIEGSRISQGSTPSSLLRLSYGADHSLLIEGNFVEQSFTCKRC